MRPMGIGLGSSSLCYLDCEKKKMQKGKAIFKPGLLSCFKTEMIIRLLLLSPNIWGIY